MLSSARAKQHQGYLDYRQRRQQHGLTRSVLDERQHVLERFVMGHDKSVNVAVTDDKARKFAYVQDQADEYVGNRRNGVFPNASTRTNSRYRSLLMRKQ